MSSEKKIAASRRNALKSTGPRTREGKAVSRLNALRHGLRASKTILPPEKWEELLKTRDRFLAVQPPENIQQLRALAESACAEWKTLHWREVIESLQQKPGRNN